MPQLHNRDGSVSTYGFACGYIERFDVDNNNRLSLFKEHGTYHIRGFIAGKHASEAYAFISDARAKYREMKTRIRLIQLGA